MTRPSSHVPQAVDSEGVYLMQGWLFHSSFWTPANIEAYLSGVPDDRMLILDLNTEVDNSGADRWEGPPPQPTRVPPAYRVIRGPRSGPTPTPTMASPGSGSEGPLPGKRKATASLPLTRGVHRAVPAACFTTLGDGAPCMFRQSLVRVGAF